MGNEHSETHLPIIAVDFDGTIAVHRFPYIGEPVPLAVETIKSWIEKGVRIILWTMRDGVYLDEAVKWCENQGIYFFGINRNPNQYWTDSPKAHARYYIDDRAVGCPLMDYHYSKVVDWAKVKELLKDELEVL